MELSVTDTVWSITEGLTGTCESGRVLTFSSGVTNSWWFNGGKWTEVCSFESSSDMLLQMPVAGVVACERRGTGGVETVRGGVGSLKLGHGGCEGACTVLGAVRVEGETGCGFGRYGWMSVLLGAGAKSYLPPAVAAFRS